MPNPQTPRRVSVGLIQMACGADKQANIARALELTREAAQRGAEVVCLQELFASPYFCQAVEAERFDLAEPIPGPSSEPFLALSAELGIAVLVSVFERRAPGLYHNTLLVIEAGRIAGLYRKMHIPDDPQFYEKYYFTPGDTGFMAVETAKAQVGPLVCWDQWYPEAARLTALAGAEILFYPTAIGWLPSEKAELGAKQHDAWRTIQRSHAIANGVYVVAVNRVGQEEPPAGIQFWGRSFVCDPLGEVLAEAGEGEEVLVVPLDLGQSEHVRRDWPFLRDRRVDAFGGITERFGRRAVQDDSLTKRGGR
ncbi:MAG: carbon-nitrogen hydrolase [Polyangiaceae bacterium]|nr:carbon-nitrogen hydrolase [Polyangiaceae bacterium]MCW5792285.1 carbon-nitrogen hydrolase [Polyangiaceae bacterium]